MSRLAQSQLTGAMRELLSRAGQRPPCANDPEEWQSADKTTRERAANKCVSLCPLLDVFREAGQDEDHGVWGGIDRSSKHRNPQPPTDS